MQHALCCVALVSALPSWQWQQKTKNKFSSIHNQTVVHFHWGEFTCVEFTTNVPKPSQTSHKFQKHSSSPRCCCKRHAASRKNANAVWQKIGFSWLLEKTSQTNCQKHHAHPGKRSCTINVPNSLANAKHAASVFRKQPLKFLSINVGTKNLCTTMQSPENVQKHINPRCYSTILQQIQSCVQRRHCCHQIPVAIPSHAET